MEMMVKIETIMEIMMDEENDRWKQWWIGTIIKIETMMNGNNGG